MLMKLSQEALISSQTKMKWNTILKLIVKIETLTKMIMININRKVILQKIMIAIKIMIMKSILKIWIKISIVLLI